MRVLLINSNRKRDVLTAPPIGLCYVATATKAAGHKVHVLDLCFSRSVNDELGKALRTFRPDVIGVSIRNLDNVNLLYPISYVSDASEIVNHIRPLSAAPIILGGSGVSLCPEAVLHFMKADYVVVSDGEKSFVSLLEALEKGQPPQQVPGIGMMVDGKFQLVPPELKPLPVWNPGVGDWINMKPYEKMGSSYTVQTKRGCDYGCIYCTYGKLLEGNRVRMRPAVDVVDEIEEVLHKFRPKTMEFVDSVFNHPFDHCVEILEEIIKRRVKCEFTAMGVSPRKLDRGFLDLMWRAGFTSFMLSPESASERMIRTYGKGFTLDDLITAAEAIKETRFTVMWYFLIGGPGESNATLQESLDFTTRYLRLDKRPPYNIANFFLGIRLYPGTKLWQIAVDESLVREDANPLEQLWYVSQILDLDMAVEQMVGAATTCPEISLGFDEKYLTASKAGAIFGRLFNIPKPYWRHIWGVNQLMLKFGARFISQPHDVAGMIRHRLTQQGYCGGHPS